MACPCGGWVWAHRKIDSCKRCGRPADGGAHWPTLAESSGQAKQAAAAYHNTKELRAPIPEDKHAALHDIIQNAGVELGLDLSAMLAPFLPSKATPQQMESESFKQLRAARAASSKARSSLEKHEKEVSKKETELKKAKEALEGVQCDAASADKVLEEALAAYHADHAGHSPPPSSSSGAEAGEPASATGGEAGVAQSGQDADVDMVSEDDKKELAKVLEEMCTRERALKQSREKFEELRRKRRKVQQQEGATSTPQQDQQARSQDPAATPVGPDELVRQAEEAASAAASEPTLQQLG